MKKSVVAFLLGVALSSTAGAEECLKKVFNEYCLGGSLTKLTVAKPGGKQFDYKGQQRIAYGNPGPGGDMISAHNNRIIHVMRIMEPEYETYTATLAKLKDLYGDPSTHKRLPRYVKNANDLRLAARAGSGNLSHIWESDGVKIHLLWTKAGLTLSYNDIEATKAFEITNPNPDGL